MNNLIDKMIVSSLFINSILIAVVIAQTSHKLTTAIYMGLLVTLGLKITKRVWDD